MSEDKSTAPEAEETKIEATDVEATDAAKPKAKKKNKRNVPNGQVHISATFNNTIITVTDPKGNKLAASSAGACGFRGSKKGTAYAAQIASEKALNLAKNSFGFSQADVIVRGTGLGRDAAIRALQAVDVGINTITDRTAVAHGGCRPKKVRKT